MLFNSFEFLCFFPIVVFLYFALPHRFRWGLLLVASYYFYMCWKAEYLILILVSTFIDYFAALHMGKTKDRRKRKIYLVLSLLCNLGLLFSFKYLNFFSESFRLFLLKFNIVYAFPELNVLLPVGISFYTFQTLSYTIDVYRGEKEPEKHLGIFALYVAFFPQLVAGPIERSTRLLKQFFERHVFDISRISSGLRIMLWGFFKKVVIADRLAILVDKVYAEPTNFGGLTLLVATIFFAFQIYCDFSGYSDIAIGSAKVMGFNLMDNFKRPYYARSISEFWKRWHISLSTWFRDYLYIPLGGNRVGKWRWYYNLFITFLISGLWHGANWTFVLWGALHGSYFILSILTHDLRSWFIKSTFLSKMSFFRKTVQIIFTFFLVNLAWVFFRADNLNDAFYIVKSIFQFNFDLSLFWSNIQSNAVGLGKIQFILALMLVVFMELYEGLLVSISGEKKNTLDNLKTWQRWSLLYIVMIGIIIFGVFKYKEFVYFQF